MLYNEFLNGTEISPSKEAYALYERVNALYMKHNEWTKEDAYTYAYKLAYKENLLPRYPVTIKNLVTGEIWSALVFTKDIVSVVIDRVNDVWGYELEPDGTDYLYMEGKCIVYDEVTGMGYHLLHYNHGTNLFYIIK